MNWLAHLFLAEPTAEFRTGSLLPDFIRIENEKALPIDLRRGVRLHHLIDAFTDAHPVVKESIGRIPSPFRRFGGILLDVWFDHFLASDWHAHSPVPLREFVDTAYVDFAACRPHLPELAWERFEQMREGDWLCSYDRLDGVRIALQRISGRLSRPFDLGASVDILEQQREVFRGDFQSFFPELETYVAAVRQGGVLSAI